MTTKVIMTNERPDADTPWYDQDERMMFLINAYTNSGDIVSLNINQVSDLIIETTTEFKDLASMNKVNDNPLWCEFVDNMILHYKNNGVITTVQIDDNGTITDLPV